MTKWKEQLRTLSTDDLEIQAWKRSGKMERMVEEAEKILIKIHMSRSTQKQTEPIRDKKFVMEFGRHKGETLETIMGEDPNYLKWLSEEGALDIHSDLLDELDENYRTAKGILYFDAMSGFGDKD